MELQQFSVQRTGHTAVISGRVEDHGQLVADFTGANSISFPAVLADLTDAQKARIVEMLATEILLMKAGVA